MSDEIEDIKIGGISAGEYIRGVKNGNIDPSFDNAVKAILWAADEIERLTAERDKWKLQAQYETDTAQAAIEEIERLRQENRKLREAIPRQILFYS